MSAAELFGYRIFPAKEAKDVGLRCLRKRLKTCTLQHTATHCNTLQHSATHCNIATHCNTLQHTATHCNTLQHTATHCNTLQHTATLFVCARGSSHAHGVSAVSTCAFSLVSVLSLLYQCSLSLISVLSLLLQCCLSCCSNVTTCRRVTTESFLSQRCLDMCFFMHT